MKAMLEVEAIGDNISVPSFLGRIPKRYWCAEILGPDIQYGFSRKFLSPQKDYAHSNSVGSRGVYAYYLLESGHLYEAAIPKSWRNTERTFLTVDAEGTIRYLSTDEATQWVTKRLTAA
jgi:hypothetical protein